MATYFHDFAGGIGDWNEVALTSGQTAPSWSVVSTDQLQATSAISHNEGLFWGDIDADADRDDAEILCQIYVDSTSTTQRWLGIRVLDSGSSRTGYALRVRSNSIDTYRFNGSTYTAIQNGSFSVTSGTWCWVRFRVNGSSIQARAWADGDSEPGSWQCDTTDSTYTNAGLVGCIKGANANTQLWRYFGVGTNGDTAPASAGPSGISGSVSTTLGGASVASAGGIDLAGSSSITLSGAALSASAALQINGATSATLAGVTLSSSGTLSAAGISGALSSSLDGATASVAGALAVSGALSRALDGATIDAAGSGQQITTGALSATLAGASSTAAGALYVSAQVSRALDGSGVSAAGHVDITAALGVALDGASIVAAGAVPGAAIFGVLARTLAGATLTAAGSETAEAYASPGYTITGRLRAFEVRGRARRFEVDQ